MLETRDIVRHPAIDALFEGTSEVRYVKGQLILQPTDSVTAVYRITSGLVKVYSYNNQGEEYIHLFYGKGEIFPLLWIAGARPVHRNIYVSATSDVTLRRALFSDVRAKVERNAALSNALLQQVVRQFGIYCERLDNLEYKYASERLAYRLLFLAGRFGEQQGESIMLPSLTQQDIAATINISRESANRELERLVRKGLVIRQGRRILICNVDGLRKELHSEITPSNYQTLIGM